MNFRAGLHEYFFIPSLVNQTVVILQKIAKILYSSYGSLLVLAKYDIIKSTPSEQPTHILRILKMTQFWHEPKTWQTIQTLNFNR